MDAILKASLPKLREKLLEALQAVLPIVAIVLVLCAVFIPVGFLVVSGTSVKMLPVDTATESPADRLVELIPDLLEQVSKKWEERKAKKQAEPEITEEDLV